MTQENRRIKEQRSGNLRSEERRADERRINLPGDWSGTEKRNEERRAIHERRNEERRENDRRKNQSIIDDGWPLLSE